MVDFAAWVAVPNERLVLVEATAVVSGVSTTRYLASRTWVSAPTDTPANTVFPGRLLDGTEISRSMGAAFGRRANASAGELRIANADGEYDSWIDDSWSGQPITIRLGDPAWAYADFEVIFTGTIDSMQVPSDTEIVLALRDRSIELESPIQSMIEIRGTLIGGRRPLCYGYPKNIAPVIHDPDGTPEYRVHEIGTVEDVAVARYVNNAPSTSPGITKDNTIPHVEFNNQPGGPVTFDTKGAKPAGTWLEKPGECLEHILTREHAWYVGLAKGGTANTITLADDASDADDEYNGRSLRKTVFSETGEGDVETKTVTDYDGSAHVATVDTSWTDNPVEGDGYQINSTTVRYGPLTTSDVDTTAFDALDTALPYQIGLYVDDGRSGNAVLDTVLAPGCWYAWTRAGKLTVGVLPKPEDETADLALGESDIYGEIEIEQDLPPVYSLRFGYDRNHTVQKAGGTDTITPTREAFIKREYRYTIKEDLSIVDDYPEARSVDVPSVFTDKSDATTERDRIWNLFSVQRYWYRLKTFSKPYQVDVGDIVELTDSRHGLSGGKNAVVVDITEFPVQGLTEMTLWG